MALNADTLLDRIYLKSQVRKWRILALVAVVAAVAAYIPSSDGSGPISRDHIARITIDGIITDDKKLDELIQQVKDDSSAVAVILRLDTPGGSAVGGEELYLNLRELAKVKPVVAVMRSMATSAGYMAALGADHIIAREGTITGSIGVIIQSAEITNLAEKLGITPVTIKSAPLKGTPSFAEKLTPEARDAVQSVVNDFYNVFVDMVTERRKLPREKVSQLADGRVYSGRQALKLQLIDALGGEKEAIEWLTKNKNIDPDISTKDREKPKEKNSLLDRLEGAVSNNIMGDLLLGLDGLVLIWHPNIL